jgi:polysaccharide deacetylase 2 family uncharacterized protein YibQ
MNRKAMARDDLNDPLGADAPAPVRAGRPWGWIAGGGLAVVAVSLGVFAWVTGDGMGGEPFAVARITTPPPAPPTPREPEARGAEATGTIAGQRRSMTAEEAEQASGVRVNRPGGAHAPGALIIQIPEAVGLKLSPAPDRRLVEKSRHGMLPRIGGDGARPADVYARPTTGAQAPKAGAPRIALVVGGLGLAAGVTENAIERLPGAVTLGFAPYGADLPRQAARAREAGHEIMLQAPMEPFDYPAMDPGPHTLRVGVDASANIDDLHWLMSRFPGYVGVANFLGARLLGDEGALAPILREIANRGLIYLDDGASGQSVAGALAARLDLQGARVDVVLDTPDAKSMEAALARLEQIAKDKGVAIGMASALPQTVERLVGFARAAEARGLALIPLSAAAARGAAPSAGRMR